MNRTTITTVLSVILLGSFFMPFFYWQSFEMNGFNFLLSDRVPSYKYLLLPIPLAVLLHIFCALSEENYLFIRKLLSWIPLATLVTIFIIVFITCSSNSYAFDNGLVFSNTGVGFWLALSLSLFLTFARLKQEARYQY